MLAMIDPLDKVQAALAKLTDDELRALAAATYAEPHGAPGLSAWIEHAADSELNRRRGYDSPLSTPDAAIDASEDERAITATIKLRHVFAQDAPNVRAFFVALLDVLTGSGRRQ